jgi:hypothetical protein
MRFTVHQEHFEDVKGTKWILRGLVLQMEKE